MRLFFPLRAKVNVAMLVTKNSMRLVVLVLSLQFVFPEVFYTVPLCSVVPQPVAMQSHFQVISCGAFFYTIASPCLCDVPLSSFLQYYYL